MGRGKVAKSQNNGKRRGAKAQRDAEGKGKAAIVETRRARNYHLFADNNSRKATTA